MGQSDASAEYQGLVRKALSADSSMKHYIHDNGRRCTWHEHDGTWRHWDHDPPEPGPKEIRDYVCRMDHYIHKVKKGPLPPMPGLDENELYGAPTWRDPATPVLGPEPDGERRITHRGVEVDYGENGYSVEAQTDLARRILAKHAPQALEHFLKRNAEYGEDNDFNLGVAGQYVDISRKVQKLKRRWWDDRTATVNEESDRVVVMELIGHLLMALDMIDEVSGGDDAVSDRGEG